RCCPSLDVAAPMAHFSQHLTVELSSARRDLSRIAAAVLEPEPPRPTHRAPVFQFLSKRGASKEGTYLLQPIEHYLHALWALGPPLGCLRARKMPDTGHQRPFPGTSNRSRARLRLGRGGDRRARRARYGSGSGSCSADHAAKRARCSTARSSARRWRSSALYTFSVVPCRVDTPFGAISFCWTTPTT